MGNFEKLSVLVIVVIIVLILAVALYTWTDRPDTAINEVSDSGYVIGTSDPSGETPLGEREGFDDRSGDGLEFEDLFSDDEDPDLDPDGDLIQPVVDPADGDDPETSDEPAVWIYEVQPGDTLSGIAQEQLTTIRRVNEIYELNPGLSEFLKRGQKLNMPPRQRAESGEVIANVPAEAVSATPPAQPGGTYVTRAGDTWEKISKRVFKTSSRWHLIWAKNSTAHRSADAVLPAGVSIQLPN